MSAFSPYSIEQKLELINKARTVLRGEHMEIADLKELGKRLVANDQYSYATEILLRKMKEDEAQKKMISVKEYQDLAKYIYKDHSLPATFKFEKALQQLSAHLNLDNTDNCETLGLAGATYKRKWQYDHQFKNLILSRFYYKKGYTRWLEFIAVNTADNDNTNVKNDNGFTGINYAYMCELMVGDKLEEFGNVTGFSKKMEADMDEAAEARQKILTRFIKNPAAPVSELKEDNPQNTWIVATVAEAFFGLGMYDQAALFIRQFLINADIETAQISSFNQQLLSIAYLQVLRRKFYCQSKEFYDELFDANKNAAEEVIKEETSGDLKKHTAWVKEDKISDCLIMFSNGGKIIIRDENGTAVGGSGYPDEDNTLKENRHHKWGLALSGGGFRASIFHIGVMAAMAEEDKLKDMEVISCVSGGSIIGAYYYLKLKLLLESKTEQQIDKQDYINIIKEIEIDFMEGVQKNLRMRIFSNLFLNIKMIFVRNYSRSHRMGDLYEKHLFKKILQGESPLKENGKYEALLRQNNGKIYMSDLFIHPKLEPGQSFSFNNDNWKRRNKIPQLVLNATSVNTGHNWQFTASWMGEPPGNIQTDIDAKPRLRRMYYSDAPKNFRKFRLGFAVGASSCVPVMFRPMPMHGLYPKIDLQLIDGGLHDNQGIAALLEEECTDMIISDGSGQLPTDSTAITGAASVFYRADSILQERLRELQFKDIKERASTTQIDFLLTVHLKNGLQQDPVSWLYCTDPPRAVFENNTEDAATDLTKYGVLKTVQTKLAELRTDLDAFSDVEAYALMYSGWSQTKLRLNPNCNMQDDAHTETGWRFLSIKSSVTNPEQATKIDTQLNAGKYQAFKLWYLNKPLRYTLISAGLAVCLALGYFVYNMWRTHTYLLVTVPPIPVYVKAIFWMVAIYVTGYFSKFLANLLDYKGYLWMKAVHLAIAFLGFIVCWIYLLFFNPLFKRNGKIKDPL